MNNHVGAASVGALFALMAPVSAQQVPEGFSGGIGVGYARSVFVGDNASAQALPILRYDTEAFSIGVPDGFRVTLFGDEQFRVSAVLAPRFSALDEADSTALDGIEREITFDGGAQMQYRFGRGTTLRLRAVTELTDEHGGHEVSAEVRQPVPFGRQPLMAAAGVTWLSGDLSRYTYGVLASEAAGGRPAYDPGSVVIPHISLSAMFPIADRASLVGSVRAEYLPDAITDSPIVDEDLGLSTFLGLTFRF